jgi:hypothetical protein
MFILLMGLLAAPALLALVPKRQPQLVPVRVRVK